MKTPTHATSEPFSARRKLLREKLIQNRLDGYLVLLPANRFYLSGFELHDPQCNESAGCLLITAEHEDWLCTDSRYAEEARVLWPEKNIHIYKNKRQESIANLANRLHIKNLGFEQEALSYSFFQSLKDRIPHLTAHKGLVEELRTVKDKREIRAIKKACRLNHAILKQIQPILKEGISEKQLAWEIERSFRENGASELAFPSIVAVGKHAALPHYIPGETPLRAEELLLIDLGCRVDNYCSDQTRTFWLGKRPSPEFTKCYQLVQQAQEVAIERIKPGIRTSELYNIVFNFFADKGVEKHFTHGLGHGVGLETHEFPGVNSKNDTRLLPGMVITIEPGLYFTQWGGIRLEKMILVTEDGKEIL